MCIKKSEADYYLAFINKLHEPPVDEFLALSSKVQSLIAIDLLDEPEQICQILITQYPDKPAGFVGLARIAFRQKLYALTVERCEQSIALFPNEFPLLNFKANALTTLDRFGAAERAWQELVTKFPDKPAGFVGLARIAFRQKLYGLTVERCEQSIALFPNEFPLLNFKADALTALDRFGAAERAWQELVTKFPDKPAGFVGLARIAFRQKLYGLTVERCEQSIALFPNEFPLLNFKADALTALDRFGAAERAWQELISKFPDKPAGFVGLARVAFRQKLYGLTVERCEQSIALFPNEFLLLNFKADALTALDRFGAAEKAWQELISKFPDRPIGFVGLARIAFKQKLYELTIERCRQFITRFPDEFLFFSFKAESYIALSLYEEATPLCQELINKYPDRPTGYLLSARLTNALGQYEKTLANCDNIIKQFPAEISAYNIKGNALIALCRFEEASQLFQGVTLAHPEKPVGYLGVTRVAHLQARYEDVLILCAKAIDLFPEETEAYSIKANVLLALNRYQEAQVLNEKLVADFPNHIGGFIGLHQLFKRLERHDLALDAIKKAYAINPKNIPVITQYVTILELMGKTNEAYSLLEHHVNGLKHNACIVPLVNLYSKYGETAKVLALLETHSEFFSKNADLQVKVGLALRNKGNILATYTIFQNYLNSSDSTSLGVLKNKFRVYEQLRLLHSIIKDHKLFKQHFIKKINLPTPPVFQKSLFSGILESLREEDFSNCELLFGKLMSDDPNNFIVRFLALIANHAQNIHKLKSRYTEAYMDIGKSPSLAVAFSNQLIFRIRHKIPTSMIRLGDGEGMFLEYPPEYKNWQEADKEHSQRIWWGDIKFDEPDKSRITAIFFEAVRNADILGVPDLERMMLSITNFENTTHIPDCRGLHAIFYHLGTKDYLISKLPNAILTSCHYHSVLEFWDLYRYILTDVNKVTVITCHPDIKQVIHEKFGIPTIKIITIPSEHRHSQNFNTHAVENNHYPDCFNTIINTLAVEQGEVFLVAAGFLGKIYCNEIKKKGGIGLDIGSIADVWMGYLTRVEHEYLHAIWGVALDFDFLRQETIPGYRKAQKKSRYRSNCYCDMNIYQEGDEFLGLYANQRKKILITGHPRCGSLYMSLLFKHFGLDINHEWFGEDGICSWLFAVQDLNMPILGAGRIEQNASYFTQFDYTLAFVRDPFAAIPSILLENRGERSYNFRRNHIINELGIDIDDYDNDLERAVASYLFWNKIVRLQNPAITFKVEDCRQEAHDFLLNNGLIEKSIDLSKLNMPTNVNSTISLGFTKPEIMPSAYSKIASHLKKELLSFCERYGYLDSCHDVLH